MTLTNRKDWPYEKYKSLKGFNKELADQAFENGLYILFAILLDTKKGLHSIPLYLKSAVKNELKSLDRRYRIYYLGPRKHWATTTLVKDATSFKVFFK